MGTIITTSPGSPGVYAKPDRILVIVNPHLDNALRGTVRPGYIGERFAILVPVMCPAGHHRTAQRLSIHLANRQDFSGGCTCGDDGQESTLIKMGGELIPWHIRMDTFASLILSICNQPAEWDPRSSGGSGERFASLFRAICHHISPSFAEDLQRPGLSSPEACSSKMIHYIIRTECSDVEHQIVKGG